MSFNVCLRCRFCDAGFARAIWRWTEAYPHRNALRRKNGNNQKLENER
jgi:hypothetical protein